MSHAATVAKRVAKPRLPANLDDDDCVTRYLERLDAFNLQAVNDELEAFAPANPQDQCAAVAVDLAELVAAVQRGDFPSNQLVEVIVQVWDPDALYKSGSTKVFFLESDKGSSSARQTEGAIDARLAKSVYSHHDHRKTSSIEGGPGRALIDAMATGHFASLADATPFLVDIAVARGLVPRVRAANLKRRLGNWMRNVPWLKCTVTSLNRPSLVVWTGWPWEQAELCLQSRALNIETIRMPTWDYPKERAPSHHAQSYVTLWTRDGGPTDAPMTQLLEKALAGTRAMMAAETELAKSMSKSRKYHQEIEA
jgi:hypothetical protein